MSINKPTLPGLEQGNDAQKKPTLPGLDVKKKEQTKTPESFEEFQSSMEGVSKAPSELESASRSTTDEGLNITDKDLQTAIYPKLDYLSEVFSDNWSFKEEQAFSEEFPMFVDEREEINKRLQEGDQSAFTDQINLEKKLQKYKDSYGAYKSKAALTNNELAAHRLLKDADNMRKSYEDLKEKGVIGEFGSGVGEGLGDYLRDYGNILSTLKDNKSIRQLNDKLEQINEYAKENKPERKELLDTIESESTSFEKELDNFKEKEKEFYNLKDRIDRINENIDKDDMSDEEIKRYNDLVNRFNKLLQDLSAKEKEILKQKKEITDKVERYNDVPEEFQLSSDEKFLLEALQANTMTAIAMDQLLPTSYNIGEQVGQSLGFMGEFMITAGIGKGVGTAIKAAGGATKAGQLTAKGLAWATQAGMQAGAMPSFYKEAAKNITETGDVGKSLWDAYSDQLIEVGSERLFMGKIGTGEAKNAAMKMLQRTGNAVANAKGWKQVALGMGEEMIEEKIADLFHGIKRYDNFDEFWDNYVDKQQNLEMMASVGIITGVLGTANVGAQKYQKGKINRKLTALRDELPQTITEHIDNRIDKEEATPKETIVTLKDIIQLEIKNDNMTEEEGAYASVRALDYVSNKLQGKQLEGNVKDFEGQMIELGEQSKAEGVVEGERQAEQIAKEELEAEKQPSYKLGNKTFTDKNEFLEEVSKVEDVENIAEINIQNDPVTANEVRQILEDKVGKDKGQEIANKSISGTDMDTQTDQVTETITEQKEGVKQPETDKKQKEEVSDAKEEQGGQVRVQGKEAGEVQEISDKDMSKVDRSKLQDGETVKKEQVKDYESKEEFKKDFLDESVVEANLTDLYVPVGKGSTMKMSERVAAAKNLREGKQTKQAKLLEEVLDNYYESGAIELIAPDKKTKVPVKTKDILRPQKELSDVEIYEEYARERAKENESLPNEGVEKTMNARDELVSEMKLSVPMEGETTKNTEKRVRGDIQQRIGKINDMLKTAKEKKYITAVENQAIRNKLKNVAKGTEYELKQAIDYAEKVIGNAEFRAKEKQKLKDIKSIRKEVKVVKADRKKGRTKAYRTPEADAFAKEANALAQEKGVLENMSAEEVADILNIIRQTKGELREKAAKKYEEYKKRMSEFEAKGRAAITPIRRKGKKAKEEYVKHGKEGRPNWVQELSDAIHETSLWIWDANLTSFISRIDALSGEGKGKVGSEFLNKNFYQGILQAGG